VVSLGFNGIWPKKNWDYIYMYICIVYVKILVISRDLPTKVWGFITGDAIG